jgi:tetratricopeptide (TPR) repeat protein
VRRIAAWLVLVAPAFGIWSPHGEPVPVERVLTNIRAQLKDRPKDPALWLVLGRIQSYAYFVSQDKVPMRGERLFISNVPTPPTEKRAAAGDPARLKESIAAFRKAVELDKTSALAYLGLGWDLEKGEKSMDAALEAYRKAYDLASKNELEMKYFAPGYEAISMEAGQRIIAILKARGNAAAEVSRLEKSVEKLAHMPRAITPVIFSFREGARLNELVAPDVRVSFDLDGMGGKRWSWLDATTGILVWDPRGTGVVESGLQLFGTATWWMFWRDGYAALSALDDDRDGWLAGAELTGIAVWLDRNQNGRSDPGEVISLRNAGIARIRVSGEPGDGGVLGAGCGVQFADGRCTPSYDWISVAR